MKKKRKKEDSGRQKEVMGCGEKSDGDGRETEERGREDVSVLQGASETCSPKIEAKRRRQ